MQDLPHYYSVNASAEFDGNATLTVDDVPQLVTARPVEFGGPGDQWSPETLLVGSVLDGFIFTFRSISQASGIDWSKLVCSAEGVLERADGETRFTSVTIRAALEVSAEADISKIRRLLEKAKEACPITRSLRAVVHLETDIIVDS